MVNHPQRSRTNRTQAIAGDLSNIAFGQPTIQFDTNAKLHQGGWINISVPVTVIPTSAENPGTKLGDALIGAWVWTDHNVGGASSDVYDECKRSGWAIRHYTGHERRFEYENELVDLAKLTGMDEEDAEEAILDAAMEIDGIDLEEIYAAALRQRLAETENDLTYRLIDAVAALDK